MSEDPFDKACEMAKALLVFIDEHGISPSDVDYMWTVAKCSFDADKEKEEEQAPPKTLTKEQLRAVCEHPDSPFKGMVNYDDEEQA